MLARVGDCGCVRSANERRYTTRTQHDHSCTAPRSSHVDCVGKSALVSSGCNKRGLKHPNNSDVEPLTCLISELQALHFKHSNMETPGMITIHPFRFFGYNTWVTKKKTVFGLFLVSCCLSYGLLLYYCAIPGKHTCVSALA